MSVAIILICVFNVVMWIVFLRHFKNLFTTEDIVAGTKEEINKILMDLNRQTERNLSLMDSSISKMKALNAEIDKKLKLLDELKNSAAGTAQLSAKINSKPVSGRKVAASAYEKNKPSRKNINSEDTVVLTRTGEQFSVEPLQTTLFNEKSDFSQSSQSKSKNDEIPVNTDIHVDSQGASYAQIPLVSPKVFVSEKFADLSKTPETLKDKILKLFDQGYDAEVISKELDCSLTEVQFVLDLERS